MEYSEGLSLLFFTRENPKKHWALFWDREANKKRVIAANTVAIKRPSSRATEPNWAASKKPVGFVSRP